MKRGIQIVGEFHEAFGCPINEVPSLLNEENSHLRHKLMEEENNEYLEACDDEDIEQIADALGDQLYVLCGTILSHGLQNIIDEVFLEIHRSNMSKLDKNGNPIINGENEILDESRPIGKILKGDSYSPPQIHPILDKLFQDELTKKFMDEELKSLLEEKYDKRDEIMKEIIKEKLSDKDWKKFVKFEKDADYFADKVKLLQERTSFDLTRFGVEIDGETTWISEKEESEY